MSHIKFFIMLNTKSETLKRYITAIVLWPTFIRCIFKSQFTYNIIEDHKFLDVQWCKCYYTLYMCCLTDQFYTFLMHRLYSSLDLMHCNHNLLNTLKEKNYNNFTSLKILSNHSVIFVKIYCDFSKYYFLTCTNVRW